jgi:hypothetical protein
MSLLIRTAYYNGYHSIKEMSKDFDIMPFEYDSDFFSQNSALLKILVRECPQYETLLTATFYAPWDAPITKGNPQRFSLPRCLVQPYFCYCPTCLQSENLTIFQDLKTTTCPIHNLKIICNCPQCGIREYWQSANLRQCKCGFLRSTAIPEEMEFFSKGVVDIFDREFLLNFKHLSWMIDSCETLWAERKSPFNCLSFRVKNELHLHLIRMATEQLLRYPGFTLHMHLAPWAVLGGSWYPLIHHYIYTHFSACDLCDPLECCSSISLTAKELIACIERQDQLDMKKILKNNFIRQPQHNCEHYYRTSTTPICELIKQLNSTTSNSIIKKSTLLPDNLINIEETCALLNLCKTTLRALIKKGAIKTEKSNKSQNTQRKILIDKPSAIDFQKKYILIVEISAILKITTKETFELTKYLNIAPSTFSHPPYIFARSDIENAMERLQTEIRKRHPC